MSRDFILWTVLFTPGLMEAKKIDIINFKLILTYPKKDTFFILQLQTVLKYVYFNQVRHRSKNNSVNFENSYLLNHE